MNTELRKDLCFLWWRLTSATRPVFPIKQSCQTELPAVGGEFITFPKLHLPRESYSIRPHCFTGCNPFTWKGQLCTAVSPAWSWDHTRRNLLCFCQVTVGMPGTACPGARRGRTNIPAPQDKQPAARRLGQFPLQQCYPFRPTGGGGVGFSHVSRGGQINTEQTLAGQLQCVLPTMILNVHSGSSNLAGTWTVQWDPSRG